MDRDHAVSCAVVIPTRNRPERLRACIERLESYLRANPDVEMIVSDDGDATLTAAYLKDLPFVRVVQGPQRQLAANRNHGVGCTRADLIVFIDDDCLPAENLIEEYRRAAVTYPEAAVFEGRITRSGEALGFADHCPENEVGGFLWGCNLAVRRSAYLEVGGFDERFSVYGMEDIDFHHRVKAHGLGIQYVPEARVWHPIEQRPGTRGLHHGHLSAVLFYHIHGINPSDKSIGFVKSAMSQWIKSFPEGVRRGRTKNIEQLAINMFYELKLAMVYALWPWHSRVAALLYPPCCAGCQRLHSLISAPPQPKAELPYR